MALSRTFRHEYDAKQALSGKLEELHVFWMLELFKKRIQKLLELFTTVRTFRTLTEYSLEGFDALLTKFFGLLDDLRRKSGDPLDYTKPSFDRDYFEFQKSVGEIDCSMQVYVNSSFESITNIPAALQLLKKYEVLLERDAIKAGLQAKYLMLFQTFGTELETVQRLYEQGKENRSPCATHHPLPDVSCGRGCYIAESRAP